MTEVLDTIRDVAVPLTVTRVDGEVNDGGFVAQSRSAVAGVSGHMQPLSPRELRNVPEGQNTLEWWHVWSLQELKVNDYVTDGTAPTVKVERIESWKEGPFWHAQATKVTDELSYPITEPP